MAAESYPNSTGEMTFFTVVKKKGFFKRWSHKLFSCPTFWKLKPLFTCPGCKKSYRCYWDGNDVEGHGTDYCNSCAVRLEASQVEVVK